MEFINFHIAYLLTKHERVIIPDFGAFVVSKANDDKSRRRGFIAPPAKYSISFNPEIIQDDGLLVRSVEREKNVGYTEALHLVYEYVDSLVDSLRTGQTVQFPWIGKIQLSGDRKIAFTPAKSLSCNAPNCGLVNLNFPYLNEASEEEATLEKKHKKKIYKQPGFYIILATIVLVLALLVLVLTNLKTFTTLQNILKNEEQTINSTLPKAPVKPAIDTVPLTNADSVKPEMTDSVKPVAADSTKLSPKYFIVVSSLTGEKEAVIMLNYFKSNGLDKSQIIRSDGKYRISIETFTDKDKAVSFLDLIKKDGKNPLFKEAWIFEGAAQ